MHWEVRCIREGKEGKREDIERGGRGESEGKRGDKERKEGSQVRG